MARHWRMPVGWYIQSRDSYKGQRCWTICPALTGLKHADVQNLPDGFRADYWDIPGCKWLAPVNKTRSPLAPLVPA